MQRRHLIATAGRCAAHLALAAAALPAAPRRLWASITRPMGRVVAAEPFGRLEAVAEGVWALVSDPFGGDRTTLCNGGLIAGRHGVLAIEGFNTPAGARWLAQQSRQLTGRWPTHVVITHYHADHASGVAGYRDGTVAPRLHCTDATRTLVRDRNRAAADAALDAAAALADAVALPPADDTVLDLGDRRVRVAPQTGHTPSDVTIHCEDAAVLFGGDLLWHGIFPNYVDADPVALRRSAATLVRTAARIAVPGHGPVGGPVELARYVAVLDEVERQVRASFAAGKTREQAAADLRLPPSLGEWTLFGPAFFPRAVAAWYGVLGDQ